MIHLVGWLVEHQYLSFQRGLEALAHYIGGEEVVADVSAELTPAVETKPLPVDNGKPPIRRNRNHGRAYDRVFDYLAQTGAPRNLEVIARALKLPSGTAASALNRLKKDGFVEHDPLSHLWWVE
jgi:hypothetical protein